MPLDPQFRVVLDTFEAKGLIPLIRGDAVTTRAHSPGGVPVRVYEPLQPRGSTLIYLHGGGWVLGDVETPAWSTRRTPPSRRSSPA